MPIQVPTSCAAWRELTDVLTRAYKGLPPTGDELASIEALIAAFTADYPAYAYRFYGKVPTWKKLKRFGWLVDDAALPLNTATLEAATSLLDGTSDQRLNCAGQGSFGPPVTVSYWNGVDTTVLQMLNTQWGMNLASASFSGGPPPTIVNGIIQSGGSGVSYLVGITLGTGIAQSGIKWMSCEPTSFTNQYNIQGSPSNKSFILQSGTDQFGNAVWAVDLTGMTSVWALDLSYTPTPFTVKLWDGDPR